jgi:hypothetical protein
MEGKIIEVINFENVTRRNTNNRRHGRAIESECVPAVFIYGAKRERGNVVFRSDLRRFRQRSTLGPATSGTKYEGSDQKQEASTAQNKPLDQAS